MDITKDIILKLEKLDIFMLYNFLRYKNKE